jgi:hypothetical protein
MSRQTLNDYLSFATRPLQLRAFSHIMSGMTTTLVIYGIIDLRIFFIVSWKSNEIDSWNLTLSQNYTYHCFFNTNVTCSSNTTCILLQVLNYGHSSNLFNCCLLAQYYTMIPMCLIAIKRLTITLLKKHFSHPRLFFNTMVTFSFT